MSWGRNLRDQVPRSLNRPRLELREVSDEQREIKKAVSRLKLSTVDVDRVAKGLERIKGNSDRQNDV